MPDLVDEFQAFVESKPYLYRERLKALQRNFYVFDKNYQELELVFTISKDTKKTLEIIGTKNRDVLEKVLLELTRRLQNFLSSALSLRDVTQRVMKKWYSPTPFYKEYKTKEKEHFGENELHSFIQCLRNYMLHISRPSVFSNWQIEKNPGTIIHKFIIPKEDLLAVGYWNIRAQAYLETMTEVDIDKVMKEYFGSIREFHTWLFDGLKTLHKADLEWLEKEGKRLSELDRLS
ncbi:MAG: hypothetical protein WEA61_06795 [Anaerolineales bacterium]